MKSGIGPKTQPQLEEKSGVGQNTISRILNAGEDSRIETVAKLAKAYDLQPWQLLVPGMVPNNPPVLQPMTKEQQEFYARINALYADLTKERKP